MSEKPIIQNKRAAGIPSPAGRRWPAGPDEGMVTQHNPIPTHLLAFARSLRKQATGAEQRMWQLLRDRRFLGQKFRRQVAVPPYIIDFYCHDLRLAVELDGGQHGDADARLYDEARTQFLAEKGIEVVRFWNNEFLQRTVEVVKALWLIVERRLRVPVRD